jgi:hypothetical protein
VNTNSRGYSPLDVSSLPGREDHCKIVGWSGNPLLQGSEVCFTRLEIEISTFIKESCIKGLLWRKSRLKKYYEFI